MIIKDVNPELEFIMRLSPTFSDWLHYLDNRPKSKVDGGLLQISRKSDKSILLPTLEFDNKAFLLYLKDDEGIKLWFASMWRGLVDDDDQIVINLGGNVPIIKRGEHVVFLEIDGYDEV